MKDSTSVLDLELKNLYALEKQCADVLTDLDQNMQDKKMLKLLKKWNKKDDNNYALVQKTLEQKNINPGSTTDSVAAEMLKNIKQISSDESLSTQELQTGLYASFNRLLHYKIACYDSAEKIAKAKNDSKTQKRMKSARKNMEDIIARLGKYGKKYFLKND